MAVQRPDARPNGRAEKRATQNNTPFLYYCNMAKTQTIGDYTIERVLGTDEMSRTYLSTHQHTSKKVVIKVMTLKNPLMTERFVTEAKQVQKIHHPNLVRVLDVGKDASTESPYIVMENVEGTPVSQYSRKNKVTPQFVRKILCDVARVLIALNEQGMVHHDINPSNILICKDGSIKLTGLGILKNTNSGQVAEGTVVMDKATAATVVMDKATAATVVMDKAPATTVVMDKATEGTVAMDKAPAATVVMDKATEGTVAMDKAPAATVAMNNVEQNTTAYLSPEQVSDTDTADIRSDIYSLGATLYAIASGRTPFTGASSSEILRKVVGEEPQPLSQLCPDMDDNLVFLIEWMMEKSPYNRPQSPREILEVLGVAMSSTSRMILGIAAMFAVVVICTALFLCFWKQQSSSKKGEVSQQSSSTNSDAAAVGQNASSNLTSAMMDEMLEALEDSRKHVTIEERLANVQRKLKKAGIFPTSDKSEASERISELAKDADYVTKHFKEFQAQVLQTQFYRIEEQRKHRDFVMNLDKSRFDAEATKIFQETLASFQKIGNIGLFDFLSRAKELEQEREKLSNEILEQLKSGKVDPNVEVASPREGENTLLYFILKGNGVVNEFPNTLKNKREILLELLKLGANANDIVEKIGGRGSEYITVLTKGGIDKLENQLIPLLKGMNDSDKSWKIPAIVDLILLNHDAHEKDEQGNTALHYAVHNNLLDVAALLIASGADVNARNKNNETPLFEAARTCQENIEKLLLDLGADATVQNNEGKTFESCHDFGLFCKAALDCDVEKLRVYLEKGFSPDMVLEKNRCTLLEYACYKENVEMAELLLKYKADIELHNGRPFTPLVMAFAKGKPLKDNKIFTLLLEHGANPNTKGRVGYLLDDVIGAYLMSIDNRIDYIKELLNKTNATITYHKSYREIFDSKYKEIYPLLLERVKEFNDDVPVLVMALANDVPDETIELLIKKKANVNCVFVADRSDFPSKYQEEFLDKKKPFSFFSYEARTALYIAVERRRLGTVKLLLEHGADKDWTSKSGKQIRQLETSEEIKELLK